MKLRNTRHYHQSVQYKRHLVWEAKSKPCVDCLAEGRPAGWPLEGMTLDHLGAKTMEFSVPGGRKREGGRRKPCFELFSASKILRELATCDPVCGGHHNMRTRARALAQGIDIDDFGDQELDDDLLF